MFRFTDSELDRLASKEMSFENWKNFVTELKSRDLPACYKPVVFLDSSDFLSGTILVVLASLVSSDKSVHQGVSSILGFIKNSLERNSATIYDFVEQFPVLMLS